MSPLSRCLAIATALLLSLPCLAAEKTDGEGVRTLYLIRHGDYDHDDERDPDVGKALVPLGVVQARLLGARLRGMPVHFDALHTSTMTRARQTAQVLADDLPGLETETTRVLRECTPPTWRTDIMEEETAEDLRACVEQLEAGWKEFFQPSPDRDRHELISAHGNVIRYFVTKALKVDTEAWLGMSIGNCSLTVIKILPDGAMKLLSFGDVGHIPPNLQTRTFPGKPRDLAVPKPSS